MTDATITASGPDLARECRSRASLAAACYSVKVEFEKVMRGNDVDESRVFRRIQ
jgi:hypothetical protein